jgi:hypothetical protein
VVATASAGAIGYGPAGTFLTHVPSLDSAVVKSDRVGGNFAYSVTTNHAYAAHTPIVQQFATPVGVSYSAPRAFVQQQAYQHHYQPAPAPIAYGSYSQPAIAQQLAYARPIAPAVASYGYAQPSAIGRPVALASYAHSQPSAIPVAQQFGLASYAQSHPSAGFQSYQQVGQGSPTFSTISQPSGTIAYSGAGSTGTYNVPLQQVASSYIRGPSAVSQNKCHSFIFAWI